MAFMEPNYSCWMFRSRVKIDFYSSALFQDVRLKSVFPDSKTFVDCTSQKRYWRYHRWLWADQKANLILIWKGLPTVILTYQGGPNLRLWQTQRCKWKITSPSYGPDSPAGPMINPRSSLCHRLAIVSSPKEGSLKFVIGIVTLP